MNASSRLRNSFFENAEENTAKPKYKELADKWNTIQTGLDREKVERKEVVD